MKTFVKDRLGVKCALLNSMFVSAVLPQCFQKPIFQKSMSSGAFAVEAAVSGETGKMIAFSRVYDSPYELHFTTEDVNHICNQEKTVPAEWIIRDGSDMSDDFRT